jgi:membrane protein required for colicin V production
VSVVDVLIALALLASVLMGARRGLVYELFVLAGRVASLVFAQWFAPDLVPHFHLDWPAAAQHALAFAALFILFSLATSLVAWVMRELITAIGLRPVDQVLGASFGLARALVFLLALAVVMNLVPRHYSEYWRASVLGSWLNTVLRELRPVLPQAFDQYLPG